MRQTFISRNFFNDEIFPIYGITISVHLTAPFINTQSSLTRRHHQFYGNVGNTVVWTAIAISLAGNCSFMFSFAHNLTTVSYCMFYTKITRHTTKTVCVHIATKMMMSS